MINFEEIFDRIKLATSTRTQVELADVLDIRQSSISDAKRRNSVPSDWYMKLFEQFGLNPDWLKKGSGPMYLRTDEGYSPVDAPVVGTVCEDVSRYGGTDAKSMIISVYSTAVSSTVDDPQVPIGKLNVPQSFGMPGIQAIKADSAGMEPYILKDAFVGVDTTKRNIASGEIYAVRMQHEGIVFKRVFIDSQNQRILLRSENPAHPEVSLPIEGYEDNIVGRVAWVLQRM